MHTFYDTVNMVTAIRRLYFLLHAGLMWTYSRAEASFCTKDQVSRCKSAAIHDDLEGLAEGGICKPNQYVEYTHECAVTNYIQTADYCCCAYEQRVFCCRYHYDWNYFRCDEGEDTIHYLNDLPLSLEILVPAIVVPSVALLCFIFYCIKCCCCNDDDDDDRGGCCYIRCNCCRRRRKRREKPSPVRIEEQYAVAPDNQRSILLPQRKKDVASSVVPEKCDTLFAYKPPTDQGTRSHPSAPPYDATGLDPHPPPYNPDLYESSAVNNHIKYAPMPFISCQNEAGQNVIYQPVLTHADMPLPVTKLTEKDSHLCGGNQRDSDQQHSENTEKDSR